MSTDPVMDVASPDPWVHQHPGDFFLCAFCGAYNGHPADWLTNPDGTLPALSEMLAAHDAGCAWACARR